ncbi:MAG: ABC transporter permease [Bacteroidetes bacterium]|nr:ABC transporter permease [Bacteroidota bacterium]
MRVQITFLLVAVIAFHCTGLAQVTSLDEKTPQTINGIEYGYVVKNEQTKTVKDEDYSRYEITLYATNKSGCTQLYRERVSLVSSEQANLIASFSCLNATGKRLTAKSGTIKAKEFYVTAKVQENGKEISKTVKAGYIFRNGETVQTNIIVIVPKGERPSMQFTPNMLPEL